MSMERPTKAIIPAAGFGTRFLPETKAIPKEMLPIGDKPIIQYVVEELVEAGIEDIIIVRSGNKHAIEDHFTTPSEELVANLEAGGAKKKPLLDQVRALGNMANFVFVNQREDVPYGNAAPLLSAAHLIGKGESFIYKFADDFFTPEANSTEQLIETYMKYGVGVFACKLVEQEDEYKKYGFAAGERVDDHNLKMTSIVEKPETAENSPSNLASVSNYLFSSELLEYVTKAVKQHEDGEFMFQPIVQQMINDGHQFYAREIVDGEFFDTGNPLALLKTAVHFGLKNPQHSEEFRRFLAEQLSR